ncbi:MAG: hypothetical protein K6E33_03520 [Lachnospiraceae bacterium]|nr:hypothetical protein [Lachnospiraceae bacterium]
MAQTVKAKKKQESSSPVRFLLAGVVIAVLVVGYYYYLNNRTGTVGHEEETVAADPVAQILSRNLETDYPPTPREVVRYYASLEQCLYNEVLDEDRLRMLSSQMRLLFDPDLQALNSEESFLTQLSAEIAAKESADISIFTYKVSSSVDVFYFEKNGYECSRLYCTYMERIGTQMSNYKVVYVLRKDMDQHWKIYGWQPVADDDKSGAQPTPASAEQAGTDASNNTSYNSEQGDNASGGNDAGEGGADVQTPAPSIAPNIVPDITPQIVPDDAGGSDG